MQTFQTGRLCVWERAPKFLGVVFRIDLSKLLVLAGVGCLYFGYGFD